MSNSGHPKDHGERRGLMLVISSPSGAGKTTLAAKLMDEFHDIALSVSATTREPRPGEVDGEHYHFKTKDEFREMISNREFLEWALVFDNLYGTPRADTVAKLEAGPSTAACQRVPARPMKSSNAACATPRPKCATGAATTTPSSTMTSMSPTNASNASCSSNA